MEHLPLNGIKVLVTRAREQSNAFSQLLEKKGAEVVKLPLIELVASDNYNEKQEVLNNLHETDWIVFTSANAVKFFFEAAEEYNVKFYFLPDLRIATVGEKTKLAIENLGFRTNFVPNNYTAEMLVEQLPDVLGKNILIPRSSKASDEYIKDLERKGANVKTVVFYQNEEVACFQNEFLGTMKKGIDYVTFTSGSTVKAFHNLSSKYGFRIKDEKVVVIGPSTEKVAKELNLPVASVADPHTVEGIIKSIEKNCKGCTDQED